MRTVAVLCVSRVSVYRVLRGVDAYDADRDARSFPGGMPVIAHPPCRSWSVFTRHQAKPAAGEQELGLWCAEQVRTWGGILEQPAHSRLWIAAKLPPPGDMSNPASWSLEVWQAWWGCSLKKATWLYFSGIGPSEVNYPFKLHPRGGDRRREQVMSKNQCAATHPAFAIWLVQHARKVNLSPSQKEPEPWL